MKYILLTILLFMSSASGATRRQYMIVNAEVDSAAFDIPPDPAGLAVEVRASFNFGRGRDGATSRRWGIEWPEAGGGSGYVRVGLRNTDFGAITDERVAEVSCGIMSDGRDSVISKGATYKGYNMAGGENTLTVEWFDGRIKVFFGDKFPENILTADMRIPAPGRGHIVSSGGLGLNSIVVEHMEDMSLKLATEYDCDTVIASDDPYEGVWAYLDRETDDAKARPGGFYELMMVRDGGRYLLLYLSGAKVNAGKWKCGMIKCVLVPTPFEGHFDAEWYDGMMVPVGDECFASIGEDGIMTVSFPLHRSRLRFYKKRPQVSRSE